MNSPDAFPEKKNWSKKLLDKEEDQKELLLETRTGEPEYDGSKRSFRVRRITGSWRHWVGKEVTFAEESKYG